MYVSIISKPLTLENVGVPWFIVTMLFAYKKERDAKCTSCSPFVVTCIRVFLHALSSTCSYKHVLLV